MLSKATQLLADDHTALDRKLEDLLKALNTNDLDKIHAQLDLFWARLAMHIRAEHLHLFPAILRHSKETESASVISELRRDHDFFMEQLSRAMIAVRDLLKNSDSGSAAEELAIVRQRVAEVVGRLASHNEVEERRVYRCDSELLSSNDQAALAQGIVAELSCLPPRFTAENLGAGIDSE